MKKTLLLLVASLALAVSCSVPEQVQVSIDSAFLTHYIQAQEALAADDYETARGALAELAENKSGGDEMNELTRKAAQAEDINAMRNAFKPLSKQAVKQDLPEGVVVAYCPMLRARWLQKDGDVANPYYGESMLTCGRIEKKAE